MRRGGPDPGSKRGGGRKDQEGVARAMPKDRAWMEPLQILFGVNALRCDVLAPGIQLLVRTFE